MEFDGSALRQARERKGLSRAALAVYAGTSDTSVARMERGQLDPRAHVAAAIARVLEVSLESLFTKDVA